MKDRFGREIDYLRVSVTDRCNLRCAYCRPEEGVPLVPHDDILRYEEITEVARAAVATGVKKVRVTGGEPRIRRDIEDLVRMLAETEGVTDLAMSTNGILLAEHAWRLKQAGLHRVNVSLDTLDAERYREIVRGGDLEQVLAGIRAALEAGLSPVKLNCVVTKDSSEPDAQEVARFAEAKGLEARFIRLMDSEAGKFSIVEGGTGGDCPQCNRLRLSSNGLIRPCLFSDIGFSVRELGAEEAIRKAVEAKPEAGGPCSNVNIGCIGG